MHPLLMVVLIVAILVLYAWVVPKGTILRGKQLEVQKMLNKIHEDGTTTQVNLDLMNERVDKLSYLEGDLCWGLINLKEAIEDGKIKVV